MNHRAAAVCCVWVFSVGSAIAAAQQDSDAAAAVVEVWGSASGVVAGPSAEAVTAYSPPLRFDGDFTSRGGQTLAWGHPSGDTMNPRTREPAIGLRGRQRGADRRT